MNPVQKVYKRFKQEKHNSNRIAIHKAKWFNNHESPVVLMVDDFSNAWYSANNRNHSDFGGDWGGMLMGQNSSVVFLKENLLDKFPEIKTVFFTVVGPIGPFIENAPFTHVNAFDCDSESQYFLRSLQFDQSFEIAYHGYNHGIPGRTKKDFIQEWESFTSLKEAVKQNNSGRKIYKNILGLDPLGGKYGGWRYNELADESIDASKFIWWCRDWMPRDVNHQILNDFYDLQFFGQNKVVAIPTTIHGHHWTKKQVDTLLKHNQVISIEEHIAKIKPGSPDQHPNIFDDIIELNKLFSYLSNKDVWFASCTDIAKYYVGYTGSLIHTITKDSFEIEYNMILPHPILTLNIDCSCICGENEPYIKVILPNGTTLARDQYKFDKKSFIHTINVPIFDGKYNIVPTSHSPAELRATLKNNKIIFDKEKLSGFAKIVIPNKNDAYYLYEPIPENMDFLKTDNSGAAIVYCIDSQKELSLISV